MTYDNIVFSHRPVLGASLGAWLERPGTIILAAAIVNQDSGDTFNAALARRIIRNRIRDAAEERTRPDGRALTRFVTEIAVPETTSAADFINALRSTFKPDPEEGDDTFYHFFDNPTLNVSGRVRMGAEEIWSTIVRNATVAETSTL